MGMPTIQVDSVETQFWQQLHEPIHCTWCVAMWFLAGILLGAILTYPSEPASKPEKANQHLAL
ncbi:hypothetical protein EV183_005540 [Coemansia sp. RSA 2336]|nr:hypothetical protein EV183_005540 [Coemansia sp. RSA 2336]